MKTTEEEQRFYASFKTVQDHLTVDIQLNRIKEEMLNQLIVENSKIIPRQNRQQLIEKFKDALDVLGYEDEIKKKICQCKNQLMATNKTTGEFLNLCSNCQNPIH